MPKDQRKLQLEACTLTIEAQVRIPTPDGMAATYAEVDVLRFRRVFTLCRELDTNKLSTELKHGSPAQNR